jgi:hypothetical protein
MEIRDPSSPGAPQDDSVDEFFRSLLNLPVGGRVHCQPSLLSILLSRMLKNPPVRHVADGKESRKSSTSRARFLSPGKPGDRNDTTRKGFSASCYFHRPKMPCSLIVVQASEHFMITVA